MSKARRTRLKAGVLLTGGAALVASTVLTGTAALAPGTAAASSHREAPLISGQPQFDNTDVYAFVSPDKPDTTTLIANWIPFEEPAGGPNFFKFAKDGRYQIHIDSTGDGRSELIYRWTFKDHVANGDTFLYNTGPVTSLGDEDLNFRQTYDLELLKFEDGKHVGKVKLADDAAVAPSNVGKASMPDYGDLRDEATIELEDGTTSFAGQADDPFFLDLRVFDLLYGGDLSEVGRDTLKGYNVNTLALQIPTKHLGVSKDQPIIGVWSTTHKKSALGGFRQVSRLGNPLVNEVVIPLKAKDKFNASAPWDDAQFADFVTEPELPKLIEGIFDIKAPRTPRDDLTQVFLTGVPDLNQPEDGRPHEALRLNTAIEPTTEPKRLGVLDGDNAGFPNGRRLTDDAIDIALQVVEGELVGSKNDLGDAVNQNDKKLEATFPYVADPHPGSRGKVAKPGAGSESTQTSTQLNTDNAGTGRAAAGDRTPWVVAFATSSALALLLGMAGIRWWRRQRVAVRRGW